MTKCTTATTEPHTQKLLAQGFTKVQIERILKRLNQRKEILNKDENDDDRKYRLLIEETKRGEKEIWTIPPHAKDDSPHITINQTPFCGHA